jgi:aminocarboxymuconate-semialdehyde decarboxylase
MESHVISRKAFTDRETKGETVLNRRHFLATMAGATAGMFVTGGGLVNAGLPSPQVAPARRREVTVGGRRVKVIDVHAHCVVPEVADVVKDTNLARTVNSQLRAPQFIMGPERLRTLDERGIDVQVLSINRFWWYAADRDLARQIVKVQNEGLAAWCAAHPDRFVALTSVALQHPDLAAEQLEQAVRQLGMRGAAIGGHVEGEQLSSPRFDPFWAKAEELGVLVFMHPENAENIVRDDALHGKGDLGNIIGNPLETTVFLSHLIFEGTLDRFPGLKICGAHAGGFLPSYLGRSEVACEVRANANCANKKHPSEYFKRELLSDSIILSEEGLRHLVAEVGSSQVVYGTDIPFDWPDGLDLILRATFLSDAEKEAILGGNLIKLLRI